MSGCRHSGQHRLWCRRHGAGGTAGVHHRHCRYGVLAGLLAVVHPAGKSPAAAAAGAGGDPAHCRELPAHRVCGPALHLFLQFSGRHAACPGRQQECPVLSDDQRRAEHRRRSVFCGGPGLGQRGLRPFHRAERGHVLPALRPVHPLESSGAAAGQTLVRV